MLDRQACERRVYRLATLLTGHPVAATRVIARVIDAQPDLRQLDGSHLDRLTVLRSREITPGVLAVDHVPMDAAEALASLTPQQREAWVFARVYQLSDREIARAMDCSVTATQRHLEQAQAVMNQINGDSDRAAKAFLEFSLTLDVPRFYRQARQRRRRAMLALKWALVAAAALALAALGIWWSRPVSTGT